MQPVEAVGQFERAWNGIAVQVGEESGAEAEASGEEPPASVIVP